MQALLVVRLRLAQPTVLTAAALLRTPVRVHGWLHNSVRQRAWEGGFIGRTYRGENLSYWHSHGKTTEGRI